MPTPATATVATESIRDALAAIVGAAGVARVNVRDVAQLRKDLAAIDELRTMIDDLIIWLEVEQVEERELSEAAQ